MPVLLLPLLDLVMRVALAAGYVAVAWHAGRRWGSGALIQLAVTATLAIAVLPGAPGLAVGRPGPSISFWLAAVARSLAGIGAATYVVWKRQSRSTLSNANLDEVLVGTWALLGVMKLGRMLSGLEFPNPAQLVLISFLALLTYLRLDRGRPEAVVPARLPWSARHPVMAGFGLTFLLHAAFIGVPLALYAALRPDPAGAAWWGLILGSFLVAIQIPYVFLAIVYLRSRQRVAMARGVLIGAAATALVSLSSCVGVLSIVRHIR